MSKLRDLAFGVLTVVLACLGFVLGGAGGFLIGGLTWANGMMTTNGQPPLASVLFGAFTAFGGLIAGATFAWWLIVRISNRK